MSLLRTYLALYDLYHRVKISYTYPERGGSRLRGEEQFARSAEPSCYRYDGRLGTFRLLRARARGRAFHFFGPGLF